MFNVVLKNEVGMKDDLENSLSQHGDSHNQVSQTILMSIQRKTNAKKSSD